MAKKKTAVEYSKEISELHYKLQDDADDSSMRTKLEYRIKKWMSLIDIHIEVANNEQKPWDSSMLGYPTKSMQTKMEIGYSQVADYVGVVAMPNEEWYVPTIVERKSISDLYGTIIDEENRTRFYKEIERFKDDSRFDKMFVIVEGTFSDFLLYQPSFSGDGFDYARRFDTKKNNIINDKKLTVVADLFIMGIPVIFADNSTLSAQMCGRFIRESVRKGYADVLGL